MIRDEFLQKIENFLTTHRMTATTFGKLVMNDSAFVYRIRAGGDVRLATMEKVAAYMQEEATRAVPLQAAE